MGFSGIGVWEIVLIIVVILLVMGPHRLPEIARTLGKAFRTIKKASSDLSLSITKEIEETKSVKPSTPATHSPPATPAITADKPSTANIPSLTDQDDHPQNTGGASAEK